jgi:hypothetical protein
MKTGAPQPALDVVSEKPYRFVPPYHGELWCDVMQRFLPAYLARFWGIEHVECRNVERLRASLATGHGILLAPNHTRHCDPFVMGRLSRTAGSHFFQMASWHLFMNGGWQPWMLRRLGAFSVFREGMDRAAINTAIEILVTAERPLVIFPEGVMSRANDLLNPLLEGTAFIARTAAKRRAKSTPPGEVVVHPVAVKYRFHGDLRAAIEPVIEEIERRLSWRPRRELGLLERLGKLADAFLSLKELEYSGAAQSGSIDERQTRLIEHLLRPLEAVWANGEADGHIFARTKRLRAAILADLVKTEISKEEKEQRWRQLAECQLAQQLALYPPGYVEANSPPERVLETVERFEEDLTGRARIHRPMSATIQVGEAIAVAPERDRKAAADPVLESIAAQLESMLALLADEGNGAARK